MHRLISRPAESNVSTTPFISGYNANEVLDVFDEALVDYSQNPAKFNEYVFLLVVKVASDAFYKCGYIPELAASFVETMLESARPENPDWFKSKDFFKQKSAFEFKPVQIRFLMTRFFDRLGDVRKQRTQVGRVLSSLTVVRLLGQFKNITTVKSVMKKDGWLLNLKMDGTWLGWMLKRPKFFTEKQSDLVIVLSELLIYNRLEETSKTVWQSNGETYVFGTDVIDGSTPLPTTYITIKVQAPKKLSRLFQKCFETPAGHFLWPAKIPGDQFKMSINIDCPKAERLGCSRVLELRTYPNIEQGIVEGSKDAKIDVVKCKAIQKY